MPSALQEKEFSQLTNLQPQSKRNSKELDLKILQRIEEDIEKCYSPPQELNNTFQESFSKKKLPNKELLKESILLSMPAAKEL